LKNVANWLVVEQKVLRRISTSKPKKDANSLATVAKVVKVFTKPTL
jgi:hypothetical protein